MCNQFGQLAIAAVLHAADGCMVGPNYKPPSTTMPATYRELTTSPTSAPAFVASNAPSEALVHNTTNRDEA